ncbi:Pectin acetylesterase 11 [Capsicum annuum]|nr:Pectin acetylesterase 11 [Capsicum annuum]
MTTFMLALVACLAVYCTTRVLGAKDDFYVNITILESATAQGAEFYNWNRVRVKYCDGSSFTGDVEQVDRENKLYFRGARIFKAIMEDLWSKGMKNAENAILSGTSAGGLATILNCDKFKCLFTKDARVKCVADAGFFINGSALLICEIKKMKKDSLQHLLIKFIRGSTKNLPSPCTSVMKPSLTIAEAVADWYFERERFQFIDPYPCAKDCKLSKGSEKDDLSTVSSYESLTGH